MVVDEGVVVDVAEAVRESNAEFLHGMATPERAEAGTQLWPKLGSVLV